MKRFFLLLSTLFLMGFTYNPDGSLVLTAKEADATKEYIGALENQNQTLIEELQIISKQLRAEKSKVCI